MEELIGIPYKKGGRDFSGCDCYGLVRLALNHLYEKDIPEFPFMWEENKDRYDKVKKSLPMTPVKEVSAPENGSILLFYRADFPVHMGVYIDGKILHTSDGYNSVLDKTSSVKFKKYNKVEYYNVI